MATHSSVLACRILWTEEPGGLQSMGTQRLGHDLVTKQSSSQTASPGRKVGLFIPISWIGKWRLKEAKGQDQDPSGLRLMPTLPDHLPGNPSPRVFEGMARQITEIVWGGEKVVQFGSSSRFL